MKIKIAVLALILIFPNISLASSAGNILACIKAVKEFTGKVIDEFDVNYTGRILSYSSAEWAGIKCEVSLDTVQNLTVDGKVYMIDGFAGRKAKRIYKQIENETGKAVSLLNSRITLLEERLDRAEDQLKQPNPDLKEITEFIATGVSKATGK